MRRTACLLPPLAALLLTASAAAAQDAAAGEAVWRGCRACHQVGEGARNLVGPELNGLFGRAAGSAPGFNFSPAMKTSGIVWDEATFAEFVQAPRTRVPETRMFFPGLKSEQQIRDLAAYLRQFGPDGRKR